MKPSVTEQTLSLTAGLTTPSRVARSWSGCLGARRARASSRHRRHNLRIVIPGTLHEIRYERATGETRVRTSATGVMGMLNRLHHAAGLPRSVASLNLWGAAVAIVSCALMLVGATGLWMWFLRRTERAIGVVLLAIDLGFALTLIGLIRRAGP